MTVDPFHQQPPCPAPSPYTTAEHTSNERQRRPSTPKGWARVWPSLLAAVTLPAVGGPAAVASYRHARDVIAEHGDPVMAPWLALTTDGMLLAALVVIWVRRHHGEPVKAGPWAAFWAGMAVTIAANLAAAQSSPVGIVVALWPPVCLAITLELIALLASPTTHHPIITDAPANGAVHMPDHAQPVAGHDPAVTGRDHRAPETGQAGQPGHDPGTDRGHVLGDRPAADSGRVPAGVPAGAAAGTNGRAPVQVPASGHGSGTEPEHQAGQNGHHAPVRTGPVPDGDILAWLREQAGTTGQVPGRRKVIDKWALGSPRADRLRQIVRDETAHNTAVPTG